MRRLVVLLLYLALLVVSLGVAAYGVLGYANRTRGIESDFPLTQKIYGTNVALEQYAALEPNATDAELQRALEALRGAGLTHARQYFPWREIEAQRGTYAWAKWDRIVDAASANNIQLVAVLDTAPVWSQRSNETDMPNAPPADFAEYARFVGDFAKRYGERIDYYQIWDEPNVEPNWGRRNADPVEYMQLLGPAAEAIRANDPGAKILLGGLAMNLELHRPHPNYSEILFLRGLYENGASKFFDIVAAKPYGMWTGPDDRTVNSGVLNFSRLILLRDEMRLYGDKAKPLWAVELGWNALPAGWAGDASPWGTDTEAIQGDRLARGLARIRDEWNWVTGVFPMALQPNVAATDPRSGFALLTPDDQPRPLYDTLKDAVSAAANGAPAPPPAAPYVPLALLLGVALVSAWRAWHWLGVLRGDEYWRAFKTRVYALPEWVQVLAVVVTAVAFYFSPNTALNLVLYALLVFLFALRLDLGIALTIFAIPFWNLPKGLFGGAEFAAAELFTWAATAAFVMDALLARTVALPSRPVSDKGAVSRGFPGLPLSVLDWAVLAFLLLGFLSTRWAGNFGVASREFRIIVLDPILLYGLVRLTPARAMGGFGKGLYVNALLASGVAVCAIGLVQYFTGDVILADGVARLTAVWGSPNNVGLYLGRLLPIALAFAFLLRGGSSSGQSGFLPAQTARGIYAVLVALFAVTILLTYSRGALFIGVPASVLFILLALYFSAHRFSRRAWLVIGGTVLVAGLAILPFLTSERFGSVFQTGTGTGFFRLAVWTSAVNMIRDHPLLGVGLDNFLYEYPKYILPEAWREPNLSHPHNFLLDFWVRLGIGGLALFLWMLVAFYKGAWRTFTTTGDVWTRALLLGLMASMVNMLAHGLIDAAYFVVDLAYVFMLTMALAQTEQEAA